jgi:hypothetical protein
MQDYQSVRNPVHVGQKPTTCGICHAQNAWRPSRIDHPWPLTGAHAGGNCSYCHHDDPPLFRGTKKECIDCHRADYEQARNHSRNPTTCGSCHTTAAWTPSLVDAAILAPPLEPDEADASTPEPEVDAAPATPTTRKPKSNRNAPPSPAPDPTPKTPPVDPTTGASRRHL